MRVPSPRDFQAWRLICFGPSGDKQQDLQQDIALALGGPEGGGKEETSGPSLASVTDTSLDRLSGPLLKTVLAMDQVGLGRIFITSSHPRTKSAPCQDSVYGMCQS